MSETETVTIEVENSTEELVKAAITRGIVALMTPGLALVMAALKNAKAKGLAVHITVSFMPDGQVLVLDPQVIAPPQPQVAAEPSAAPAPEKVTLDMDALVARLLSWQVPPGFACDECAADPTYPSPRYGTNLVDATAARAMLEHVLGVDAPAAAEQEAENAPAPVAEAADAQQSEAAPGVTAPA